MGAQNKRMKAFFIIIFFKFFQFSKSIGNVDDNSYAFKSVAILSLFISLNLFTAVAYYKCLLLYSNELQLSVALEVLIVLIIGSVVYLLFYSDEKYKEYFNERIEQSAFKGSKGTLLTIFYMAGSIALLATTIWLDCKR